MATQQSLFNALQAGRTDAKRAAYNALPYSIHAVTKAGTPAKTATDRKGTYREAYERSLALMGLNPGWTFVVLLAFSVQRRNFWR